MNTSWKCHGQIMDLYICLSHFPFVVLYNCTFFPTFFTFISLHCRYQINPQLNISNQDELKHWLLAFIPEAALDKLASYHSVANWANIFGGLVSTLLVAANYNSYAAELGASLLNIATFLVDTEKSEEVKIFYSAKLEHPFAIGLMAGNEEEKDNVFVEYSSHVYEKLYLKETLTREEFVNNCNGKFLAALFGEKGKDGKFIPRPTKSCRPDFILCYKGCLLMYRECKLGIYDTKEGLSLTTMLSANILNYTTPSTLAIVLHTNDFRFHVQVITLNTDNSTLCVWQRDSYAYHLNPQDHPPVNRKGQGIQQEYIHIPLVYKYGKVLWKYLNPDELPNKNIYNLPQYP